jgi:hypothetical protein
LQGDHAAHGLRALRSILLGLHGRGA